MAFTLQLFLIYFCLGQKSSQPYATKWISFGFYTNGISMQNLSYLDAKVRKSTSTELKLESSPELLKRLPNYGNLYTIFAGCVKLKQMV